MTTPNLFTPPQRAGCLIAGAWEPAAGSLLPATEDPATEAPRPARTAASPDQIGRAVTAATASGWTAAPRAARRAALARLRAAIAARHGDFAETISAEIGAPIDFARSQQVDAALAHLDAYAAAFDASADDTTVADSRPADRVRFEPVGPVALITPWNWPLNQVALKVGAALLAGCPMVLKPSELATATAELFAACTQEADLPPGVFNLVPGDGATGAALVAAPGLAAVSFTGSTRAGAAIAAAAAPRFLRTVLEMGGKSANLLFPDCGVERAVSQGLAHCFRNNGQSCNAASRMLVARQIYDEVVEAAARLAASWPVAPPDRPGKHLGPQVSRSQYARVQGLIEAGLADGGRLIAGGPDRPAGIDRGFYTRPTVFADVPPRARIFREEIFGPVLTITPFDGEAEAIALANDSSYGLAGYIQTADLARADRVARALAVGMVQINGLSRAPGAPFGGVKASGLGRESGLWGIRALQEVKSISGAPALAPD